MKTIAIVAPVYNEHDNVDAFVAAVDDALRVEPHRFVIVLVDDGSDAQTREALDRAAHGRDDVTVLHLSRNFGHQAALSAGYDHAASLDVDAVVCLDSDLQHPPRLIPDLLRQWELGFDVVGTIRDDSDDRRFMKVVSSALYYRLLSFISDRPVPRGAADFRLLSRAALQAVTSMPERARFLRGLISWIGFRQVYLPYKPEKRHAGQSKYTIGKMVRLALDGVISTTTAPLRAIVVVGGAVSSVAVLYMAYIVIAWFTTNRAIVGWSSLISAVLFLGGINLVVLGVVGLYVGKVYEEVKARPLYLVRHGRDDDDRGTR